VTHPAVHAVLLLVNLPQQLKFVAQQRIPNVTQQRLAQVLLQNVRLIRPPPMVCPFRSIIDEI
jgi:hypothetical protein